MLGESVDVEETAPGLATRQQHDRTSKYHKRNHTIPIVDHLISELDPWFDLQYTESFTKLLPFDVVNTTVLLVTDNFSQIINTCIIIVMIYHQKNLWQNKWSTSPCGKRLNSPKKVLAHTDWLLPVYPPLNDHPCNLACDKLWVWTINQHVETLEEPSPKHYD